MLYNRFKKGSEASYAAEPLVAAFEKMETAAEEALDFISTQEDELEEKQEEIDDLTDQIEELEKKLANTGRDEFIRILNNIRVYINDAIMNLEKSDGRKVETEETTEHGGEQPTTRSP